MKKAILVLFVMMFSFSVFSKNQYFDVEKVKKDSEKISQQIDTSKVYAEKSYDLLKKEIKMWGLKKTLQVNANVFLPITIFLILFLVWLKNKK
jgi:hypothetical protein